MKPRLVLLLLLVCVVVFPFIANAQWVPYGTSVCTALSEQEDTQMISDGAGGAILVWSDYRASATGDIYAQKLDAYGVPKWPLDGVAVCTAVQSQTVPVVAPDGAGGCIIAWSDERTGSGIDIYAQRISAAGSPQWAANGVLISNAANDQFAPAIVSDGVGGAVIAWQDSRNGPDDIFAQRVNSAGAVQWAANGRSVSISAGAQQRVRMTTDGAGGVILTWMDFRSGVSYDIYAQRMTSAGNQSWTAGGIGYCTLAGSQAYSEIVSDGAGGAILAWQDHRGGLGDIFAQRVNGSGAALWTANGVGICLATGEQWEPSLTTDGAGGAIMAWRDYRGGGSADIYARRVSAAGVPLWQYNGVPICVAAGEQFKVVLDSDGAGGAVMAWLDQRISLDYHVFAQRIKNTGAPVWDVDGVAVNDKYEFDYDARIVSGGNGAGIVAWRDFRSSDSDIFAQRVEGRYGAWGHPEPTVTSVADVRNDQGGHVKVNWKASDADALGFVGTIAVNFYTIWRATDAIAAQTASLVVDTPAKVPSGYTGKAIYVEQAPATDYYWELVGSQTALKVPGYSFSAETRADSVLGNSATHQFMVAANTPNEYIHWPSNSMSGRSVDNLAPAAPLFLTALRAGSSVVLKWNRVRVPDLRDYSVYRQTTTGVTPIDPNFLDSTDDSTLVDTNAPASALFYIVTANDVHANQSAASNEAAVSPSTGTGNTPPITALTVMQNRPNPFTTTATFDVGLPAAARVDVEIFDIAGRRVASRSLGSKPAGWQSVTLDAADDAGRPLASGVYFYRIHAAGQSITRKMVIAR